MNLMLYFILTAVLISWTVTNIWVLEKTEASSQTGAEIEEKAVKIDAT